MGSWESDKQHNASQYEYTFPPLSKIVSFFGCFSLIPSSVLSPAGSVFDLSPLFLSLDFALFCCGAVFQSAISFNGDLSTWEVGKVTTMAFSTYTLLPPSPRLVFFWGCLFSLFPFVHSLILFLYNAFFSFFANPFLHVLLNFFLCCCGTVFWNARAFNGDLSTWQVGKVTDMRESTFTLFPPSPRSGLFWAVSCFSSSLFYVLLCTDYIFEQFIHANALFSY